MGLHNRWVAAGCAGLLAGLALLPAPAQAWWRGGVFLGFPPVVVAPPYYPPPYYPPAYYPPPPVVYAPPPAYNPQVYTPPGFIPPTAEASVLRCYAGGYVCPLDYATPRGAACYCIGNGGQPTPGRVGG